MAGTRLRRHGVGLVAAALLVQDAVAGGKCCKTIRRDVAVIGGGASGAHAAVWLRDHDYSVVVVEKADQLGGHTDFYTDPASGKTVNIGVQAWMEYKNAFDFPVRMNVSTSGSMQFYPNTNAFVDFVTGLPVDTYTAPSPDDMFPALHKYLDAISPYEDMVLPGFFDFPEGEDIPEDLLMTFGEFVEKYGIQDAVPQVWDSTAMGLGDTMDVPALWVIQASGIPMVKALLGVGAAAVPASGRLFDLFDAVAEFLGNDVLYSSTVASADRHDKGVSLEVHGAAGQKTCIEAKRLLVAFEPTAENLAPFNPDETETEVFDRFGFATVYAGVLRHPSLQADTAYSNRLTSTGPSNYTEFPLASQVGSINFIGGTEDLFQFTAVGTEDDTPETMKALISETIDKMIEAGTLPVIEGAEVTYGSFADHGKMHPRVSAEELKDGFVQRQLALQGHLSTWYTGAAFSAGFATVLWEYNEVLLPQMVGGL